MKLVGLWEKEYNRLDILLDNYNGNCINEIIELFSKFINNNKYFKINENNKDKIKLLVRKMQNILEQDNLGDKLLINCLENNKIIDVTLLLYFANTLLKENNINGNIEIKNGINAAATNSDWDFYFDYNRLLKPFANNYDYRKNKGYIDIINSTLLYTVTHEMSHSLDMKKALENNDYLIDLEYALLDTFEQINAKVYLEKHDYFLIEHLAYINGYEMLEEIMNNRLINKKITMYHKLFSMYKNNEMKRFYKVEDGVKTLDPRSYINNYLIKSINNKELQNALINLFADCRNKRMLFNDEKFITNPPFTEKELNTVMFSLYANYLEEGYYDTSHEYVIKDIKLMSKDKLFEKYKRLTYKKMLQRLFKLLYKYTRLGKLSLLHTYPNNKQILLKFMEKEDLEEKNLGWEMNLKYIKDCYYYAEVLRKNNIPIYLTILCNVNIFLNDIDSSILDKITRYFSTEEFQEEYKNFILEEKEIDKEFMDSLKVYLQEYDKWINEYRVDNKLIKERVK